MNRCLARAIIYSILLCIALHGNANEFSDSLLPAAIKTELAAFREKDDLEGWIYHRMQYTDKKPVERIGFLMETEKVAWRKYATYEERIAWLYLLATQGYYQLQSGNILASISAYENALQFYESYPLPDADIIEYVLKPLGNNYTRLADYNTALFIHQKTLTAALKKGDRNTIASVYSNMAACSRWKGDLKPAVQYCIQGIEYVDKKKLLYGLLLSTYADVLTEEKRFDTAGVLSRQALELLQHFGNDMQALYWYTSALQIAARIATHEAAYSIASQYAKTALQLFKKYYPSMRQREKAKLYVLLGDISQKTGANAWALEHYQQALKLLIPAWKPLSISSIPAPDQFYGENTFGDALAGKAAALAAMGKRKEAIEHYLSCFAAERILRSAFYYAESKYRELEITRPRAEAAMRLAYEGWNTTKENHYARNLFLIAELSKAQVLADERNTRFVPQVPDTAYRRMLRLQEAISYYQNEMVHANDKQGIGQLLSTAEYELALLTKKMRHANFHVSAANVLTGETLDQLFQKIPNDLLFLQFLEGSDRSYIIEAGAGGVRDIRCFKGGRQTGDSIRQFMQQWFAKGAAAMLNDPKKFYQHNHEIYKTIFGNYTWKTDYHYVLLPDGVFSYIPFDALLTQSEQKNNYRDWPFLLKKINLSYAWSAETWFQQQNLSYTQGPFIGFFVGVEKAKQQPELLVDREYRSLQSKLPGLYYTDASATWQQFNTVSDSAGVLHIGSHAATAAGDSLPYLQLYDKPFYLFDLRYRKFSPSLVVLGACNTGYGQLLTGEGVNSLSRGFTAAGAGGVVSGLWNVNDETAIQFMELFYDELKLNNAAVALQNTKKRWLEDHADNPALQLPYYWSAFVYNGHLKPVQVRPVTVKQAFSNKLLFISLGVALLLAFPLYYFFFGRKKPA